MSKRVCMGEEERKNENGGDGGGWEGMNPELLASILVRIPAEEMMRVVPLVCRGWWEVVAGPHCWKNIDLQRWSHRRYNTDDVDTAVKKLVKHSRRTFERLSAYRLGNVGFAFVANRATCLKILKMPLAEITDQMVIRHAESLSCLTYLDISCCLKISSKGLEAFGKHCKSLTHLRRSMPPPIEAASKIDDMEAIIVANTMSGLNNLELCYGSFGDHGLDAILTKCKALTHIDIQGCWGVTFEGDPEKKCEKLAVFKGPWIEDDYETDQGSSDNKSDGSSDSEE